MRHHTCLVLCILTMSMTGLPAPTALAQSTEAGCALEPAAGGRSILRCADGLSITVEPGARYSPSSWCAAASRCSGRPAAKA